MRKKYFVVSSREKKKGIRDSTLHREGKKRGKVRLLILGSELTATSHPTGRRKKKSDVTSGKKKEGKVIPVFM